ncbi:MAG: phage portal protein [Firmicutes bacterium]|nr:phage portal protein [Bacillota bacterium]
MGVFNRKKTKDLSQSILSVNVAEIFSDFGSNILNSDTVKICIDCIASHASKLKPRHIKESKTLVEEQKGSLSYLLKHQPNELMSPSDFIYKIVSLLYLNNNVFIYPKFNDRNEMEALYPIKPNTVEVKKDASGATYLEMYFDDGKSYLISYDSLIHLKRYFYSNEIFGGNGAIADHRAVLKTIAINDSILQGIDNAIKSSFQIKGLLKMNAMLSQEDKNKQKEIFDNALRTSIKENNSAIIPVDLKADYVPLSSDPKLVDAATLDFLNKKILSYFRVSEPIYNNNYTEEQFNSFYEGTIEQLSIKLSEEFSRILLSRKQKEDGEQIIFYSERLQYASWNTKVNAIEKLMGLGLMSLNESRSLLGLEPVEDGNKRLQSLNYVDSTKANDYQVGK